MESKLQKLKVTELKELLAKHDLPQTGKKDDLVKRLVENNISPDGDDGEDLVDPDAEEETNGNANTATETATESAQPVESADKAEGESDSAPQTTIELTPDQQAMKARAERFGIPFNPNPTPRPSKSTPKAKESTPKAEKEKPAAVPVPAKKEKAGGIDKTSLGISEDVLAKRAAKFGLPEKKSVESSPASAPAATNTAEAEVTPEQAEKIAAEEEKKRKRAEKFGTAKPETTNGSTDATGTSSDEPAAKKNKA